MNSLAKIHTNLIPYRQFVTECNGESERRYRFALTNLSALCIELEQRLEKRTWNINGGSAQQQLHKINQCQRVIQFYSLAKIHTNLIPYRQFVTDCNDEIEWRYRFALANQSALCIELGQRLKNRTWNINDRSAQRQLHKINQCQRITQFYKQKYLNKVGIK